jgi:hypothetical protein
VPGTFRLFAEFERDAAAADRQYRQGKWLEVWGRVSALGTEQGLPYLEFANPVASHHYRTIRCYCRYPDSLRDIHTGQSVFVAGGYLGHGGGVIVLAATRVGRSSSPNQTLQPPIKVPDYIPGR